MLSDFQQRSETFGSMIKYFIIAQNNRRYIQTVLGLLANRLFIFIRLTLAYSALNCDIQINCYRPKMIIESARHIFIDDSFIAI